jgi:hypothetical protein
MAGHSSSNILSYHGAHEWADYIKKWGLEPVVVMPLTMIGMLFVAMNNDPDAVSGVVAALIGLSPIWLPVFLAKFFWITWMHYIRYSFWFAQEYTVLEIQLPAEIEKSPLAMELILTAMHNAGGETTFIARIWEGKFRPIWTLEIASNEGRIGYYIHLRKGFKNQIEARIYGQYPEARVTEVPDYAAKIPFNLDEYNLWGTEYEKSEPHALPIKSYIDYGLNESTDKPEIQIDPLTNIFELLGTVGKDEYFWIQIVMKARKKDEWFGFYKGGDRYADSAKEAMNDIMATAAKRSKALRNAEDEENSTEGRLTEGEKKKIEAIERSLGKLVFECGIRAVYLAKHDTFNGINIPGMILLFAPFKSPGYNGLGVTRGHAIFDYPWQDLFEIRHKRERRRLFFRYKNRAYFYVPYDQKPVCMTTEELATLWHFPGSAVKTPALDRVPTRRAEAPINLPT